MPRNARQIRPRALTLARPKVTAVVPAFNEAGNILRVIAELRSCSLEGFDLDFVVVDDGSADGTAAAARGAGARLLSLPYNLGIGVAVQTGFRFALDHGADFVVQVDGDGQHIASELPRLVSALKSGQADVVVGSRFVESVDEGLEATTTMRWLAGRVLSWNIRLLTGQRIVDTTSGFRLFSQAAAELVARSYPDDYPEAQVLVMLARQGFRIRETPVRMRSREQGRSSINWWRAAYYVFKVLFASFMDKVRK